MLWIKKSSTGYFHRLMHLVHLMHFEHFVSGVESYALGKR